MANKINFQSDNERLPAVPNGWIWTILENLTIIQNGYAFKKVDYKESGIPLLRISNIENNQVNFDKNVVFVDKSYQEVFKKFLVEKGDIIIALSGATAGKYGIYNKDYSALLNQRVGRIIFSSPFLLDTLYLLYYMEILRAHILKKAYGMAQPNISTEEITEFFIPLPPFNEQHRIVARIEELFTQLDAGIASMKKAQAQLKRYRQTVLTQYFEGKSQLIKLDDDWKMMKLRDITIEKDGLKRGPFGSAIKKSFFVPHGFKVYEQGNAINGDPYRGSYYVDEKKFGELKKFQVFPHDLIISCSGTLGRIIEIPDDAEPGIINQALLRVRLNNKIINNLYFIQLFRTSSFQKLIFSYSQGTAMPNLVALKQLKEIEIKIPPLQTQFKILKEIQYQMSTCDKIDEIISEILNQSNTLRQSILKQAFEGKLVSQDPHDEPASVLLERIKAEIEQHQATSETTRTPRKKKVTAHVN